MENYILDFTLNLFNAPPEACAITSFGGTDSIANAVLSYKLKYLERGIIKPNIVASVPTHVAMTRACGYYGIEVRFIPYLNF